MTNFDNDQLAAMGRELFPAVVGDVLDTMGLHHQFLPPRFSPIQEDMTVIGRAMPVLEADTFTIASNPAAGAVMSQQFGLMFNALDDLKPQEVYICTGSSPRYALWGELMSIRARQLGAAGAVLDGYSRDTTGIIETGFPVFSRGNYAQDQGVRGKVIDFRTSIEIDGIQVNPGDIVFGDRDGVLIIPEQAEEEAFRRALEKVRGEHAVRDALLAGMSATDAFRKFGIM